MIVGFLKPELPPGGTPVQDICLWVNSSADWIKRPNNLEAAIAAARFLAGKGALKVICTMRKEME
jgi:hypothetical protein